MKISTALPKELKKSRWFTDVSGSKDGTSYVEVDIVRQKTSSNYGAQALARLQNAEVEYWGPDNGMLIKVYHDSARDADHDLARVFNAIFADITISTLADGRSEYYGYLTELNAFEDGETFDIADDDSTCYCKKKHGWVDSFLPPNVFDSAENMGARLLVRITVYPTKKFTVEVDKD